MLGYAKLSGRSCCESEKKTERRSKIVYAQQYAKAGVRTVASFTSMLVSISLPELTYISIDKLGTCFHTLVSQYLFPSNKYSFEGNFDILIPSPGSYHPPSGDSKITSISVFGRAASISFSIV
jgi:hypothetical protein